MEDGILTPPQTRPRLLNGLTHRESNRRSAEQPAQAASDTTSQRLAARMLQGWAMLADHCPRCYTPLMRSRQQELECVTCNMPVRVPTAAAHIASDPAVTVPGERDQHLDGDLDDEPPEPIATPRQEVPAPVAFPVASHAAATSASAPAPPALQPSGQHPADDTSSSSQPTLAPERPSNRSQPGQTSARQSAAQGLAAGASPPAGHLAQQLASPGRIHVAAPFSTAAPASFASPLHNAAADYDRGGDDNNDLSARPASLGPQSALPYSLGPAPRGAELNQQTIFDATRQTILQKMEEARTALETTPAKDCCNLLSVLSHCTSTLKSL
ncbi:hypothetical protein WJX74_011117 [Apatococcus lobatus]|uniref:Uncharacterized protein n=1 Tax=Apatococcus lobatus TaxID=904363 RepID=A0AAW1RWF7_9CHLO